MFTLRATITVFAVFVSAVQCLAQHGGDILLSVQNGRITTSSIDPDSGEITPNVRVFPAEFGEFVPNQTDEPGCDSLPGTFSPGTSIGFRIRTAIRRWTGAGFISAANERIEINFADLGPVVSPVTDMVVTGFTLPVGSNGQWHRHLVHTLTAGAQPIADGVYLLELSLFSTDPMVGESDSFWIVFNQNDEAEHDTAVGWVSEHLAGTMLGCQPADIADDQGNPLPTSGPNGGVNEGDFNAFFQGFFEAAAYCNIADDQGNAPPAPGAPNGGVNEGDFNAFFQNFFSGCP